MVARRILRLDDLGLYASPGYIEQHGEPATPAELCEHECLRHLKIPEWQLINASAGEMEMVNPKARVSVANFQALQNLSLADMGITVWHSWPAKKRVEAGQLVRVLPEWSLQAWEFYAVTTSRHIPAKVRALSDFLIEKFRMP